MLIDDNGSIDIDDDLSDVDFGTSSEELLLLEDEAFAWSGIHQKITIGKKVPEKITKNKKSIFELWHLWNHIYQKG